MNHKTEQHMHIFGNQITQVMAYMKPLQTFQGSTYFKQHLENKMISGGPTNEVRYNPNSLAKLVNRIFLEAMCLSKAHDSITKSIMSSLKVWLVASNFWVCFFSSLRSF